MKTSSSSDHEQEFRIPESFSSSCGSPAFSQIRTGDLIFCRMPGSEEFLASIPEGHRARPYLILAAEDGCLYGFACSHKHSSRIPEWQQYELRKQDYPEFLYFGQLRPNSFSTFVSLDQLNRIPAENALSFSLHIHPDDLSEILRICRLIIHLRCDPQHSESRISSLESEQQPWYEQPGNIYHVHQDLYFLITDPPEKNRPARGLFVRLADDQDLNCEPGDGGLLITDIQNHRLICTDFHSVFLENAGSASFASIVSRQELSRIENRLNSVLPDRTGSALRSRKSKARFAFYWPSGSVLVFESSGNEFIYLFSEGGRHCLADLESFLSGDFQLFFTDDSSLQESSEQIDEISFDEILGFLQSESDHPHPTEAALLRSYSQFHPADAELIIPDDPDETET